MTVIIDALSFDAHDPARLAQFWAALLDREADGFDVLPAKDTQFKLTFVQSDRVKDRANQMHFDLTSATPEAQQAMVAKALELGANHIDIGQTPEEGHIVLADPEGNEFCVIEAGNNFLAGTDAIGALSSDGSQAVGYFWSKALNWPLVWDQDEETAIQSPNGGSKISWGGPPVAPKAPTNRLRLDLKASNDLHTEVAHLTTLGARQLDTAQTDATQTDAGRVDMADPDGNEFSVLAPS